VFLRFAAGRAHADPFGSDPNDLPLDSYLATFRQSLFAQGIMRGQKKGWAGVKLGMKLDTTEPTGNAIAMAAMGAAAMNKDTKRTEETAHKVEEKAKDGFWVRPPETLKPFGIG
jgi:hypothetical protein